MRSSNLMWVTRMHTYTDIHWRKFRVTKTEFLHTAGEVGACEQRDNVRTPHAAGLGPTTFKVWDHYVAPYFTWRFLNFRTHYGVWDGDLDQPSVWKPSALVITLYRLRGAACLYTAGCPGEWKCGRCKRRSDRSGFWRSRRQRCNSFIQKEFRQKWIEIQQRMQ